MAKVTLLQTGMSGVDMKANPSFLPPSKVASATNIQFDEGVIRTRPGAQHSCTGARGQMQGSTEYSPSRGISHMPFADPYTALVLAVGGNLTFNLVSCGEVGCCNTVCGDLTPEEHYTLFQAENYLIGQSPRSNTFWWEGDECLTFSPGLGACEDEVKKRFLEADIRKKELAGANIDCCYQKIEVCEFTPIAEEEEDNGSHDTFVDENHRNFLINSADNGIYAHGRIHQQGPVAIYVSDIIHKRGGRSTSDILLMEEQALPSYGDPIAVSSRLGRLRAMALLPSMSTANGEGSIIAYYDRGVVSIDTFIFPREERIDGDGVILQQGWASKQHVTHLLNRVSAAGRYAVAVLPRDHVFRSPFGLHFLKISIGEGTFKDEMINSFSQDVQPILDCDQKHLLSGSAVGQWTECNRIMASTGMYMNTALSVDPVARGFVVWNQATTFSEDRTPASIWEGLWKFSEEVAAIHRFIDIDDVSGDRLFGALTSTSSGEVHMSSFNKQLQDDWIDGKKVPIKWQVTTRRDHMGTFSNLKTVSNGFLEVVMSSGSSDIAVYVRTDSSMEWELWKGYEAPCDSDEDSLLTLDLGQVPIDKREATWYQVRVEGQGCVEIRNLELEYSVGQSKTFSKTKCSAVSEKDPGHFDFIS